MSAGGNPDKISSEQHNEETFTHENAKEMIKDELKGTRNEERTSPKEPNRILLAGFMNFNDLSSHLVAECKYDFSRGIKSVHEEWQKKAAYMNKLHQVDPYGPAADIMLDVSEQNRDYVNDKMVTIRAYPQYRELKPAIKMIRIDYLTAFQHHIDLDRVNVMAKRVKPDMTERELIDFCIDTAQHELPIDKQLLIGPNPMQGIATFVTNSDDVRLSRVEYREVPVHEEGGKPLTDAKAKALVLLLQLGNPFIMVYAFPQILQIGGQTIQRPLFVLNNGFHRAYALKKAGYSHIPSVFCELTAAEAPLYLLNWQNQLNTIANYQRPPLLKDFLNPELSMHVMSVQKRKIFKISWNAEVIPVYD